MSESQLRVGSFAVAQGLSQHCHLLMSPGGIGAVAGGGTGTLSQLGVAQGHCHGGRWHRDSAMTGVAQRQCHGWKWHRDIAMDGGGTVTVPCQHCRCHRSLRGPGAPPVSPQVILKDSPTPAAGIALPRSRGWITPGKLWVTPAELMGNSWITPG